MQEHKDKSYFSRRNLLVLLLFMLLVAGLVGAGQSLIKLQGQLDSGGVDKLAVERSFEQAKDASLEEVASEPTPKELKLAKTQSPEVGYPSEGGRFIRYPASPDPRPDDLWLASLETPKATKGFHPVVGRFVNRSYGQGSWGGSGSSQIKLGEIGGGDARPGGEGLSGDGDEGGSPLSQQDCFDLYGPDSPACGDWETLPPVAIIPDSIGSEPPAPGATPGGRAYPPPTRLPNLPPSGPEPDQSELEPPGESPQPPIAIAPGPTWNDSSIGEPTPDNHLGAEPEVVAIDEPPVFWFAGVLVSILMLQFQRSVRRR